MQFDWFLSVLEQKRLENHEIYYIGPAELPLKFTHCSPLLGWRYLYCIYTLFCLHIIIVRFRKVRISGNIRGFYFYKIHQKYHAVGTWHQFVTCSKIFPVFNKYLFFQFSEAGTVSRKGHKFSTFDLEHGQTFSQQSVPALNNWENN